MKAFATFKKETLRMPLVYGDDLVLDNNGAKYLLGGQYLFNKIIHVKGMKTKDLKGKVGAFLTTITKKKDLKIFDSTKGNRICWRA